MEFQLTNQQEEAVQNARTTSQNIAITAGAGAGKTATLRLMAEALQPKTGLYLAFNKSIAQEAQSIFPSNVQCATVHSMAWRQGGYKFKKRMSDKAYFSPASTAANAGFYKELSYELREPAEDGATHLRLDPGQAMKIAGAAIRNFCTSAAPFILCEHVPRLSSLSHAAHIQYQDDIAAMADSVWDRISDPADDLILSSVSYFDIYLKVWQLSQPRIKTDFILFDEAQDANPLMLDVILQQEGKTQLIFVGDPNQQIYAWNGAVNAMERLTTPTSERSWVHSQLTHSFRFGPAIADVANKTLAHLSDYDLVGAGPSDSQVCFISEPRVILARTNLEAIRQTLQYLSADKTVHLVGGTKEIEKFAKAAKSLKAGKATNHPLLSTFQTWRQVKDSVEEDPDGAAEFAGMVKLVESLGEDVILDALALSKDTEEEADIVVSTAHKAKGREWPSVKIAQDFNFFPLENPEEARLLYVAVTRAQQELDITLIEEHLASFLQFSHG